MAHVLAIDDDPAHLTQIASLLSADGHRASAAPDAEIGLQMIDVQPPDLVVCDIRLPTLSGFDVVRRLKHDPATRRLPVIAVTAVAEQEEAMRAGFDGYLAKPVSLPRLRAEIARLLPGLARAEPTRPAKAAGATAGWAKARLARSGKRILVLDNTEANRELLRVVLDYGGHAVACAHTVARAFAVARTWRPHLVLCDVHLDHELGSDLLRAIRDDPDLHDTRFAFTSASPGRRRGREEELLKAGACGYLRLPMKPQDLLRRVGELLA